MLGLRALAAILLAGLLVAGCGTTGSVQDIQPGERPDLQTDEAGLWMKMDRVEAELRSSGQLVEDRKLNAYVRGIVCKLAPEYCQDIRVYLVRTAGFNAAMAPNGAMMVWTGLLLRCRNEAQLAYILGHELAHYIQRHSLQQWRDLRSRTTGATFFQLATALTGLGLIGDLAYMGTMANAMAFSRDHEREADRIGFERLRKAGYRTTEAPKIWEYLEREKAAGDDDEPLIFFSSHPASDERRDTLTRLSQAAGSKGRIGRKAFRRQVSRFRRAWLRDELLRRDYPRFGVLTAHLLDSGMNPGEVHFMKGEMHRLRAEDGDSVKAVAAYRRALKTKKAPVETLRSLGLVLWSMNQEKDARQAFKRYIARNPRADDRAMVEDYINQLN